jgi:hypothetical protein
MTRIDLASLIGILRFRSTDGRRAVILLSFVSRPDHRQPGAPAGLANDPQLGANGLGALAHDAQAHALRRNIIWVKAPPIVADAELDLNPCPFPFP